MAAPALQCQDKSMARSDKDERLAAALRENLRRRKAQARSLTHPAADEGERDDRPD